MREQQECLALQTWAHTLTLSVCTLWYIRHANFWVGYQHKNNTKYGIPPIPSCIIIWGKVVHQKLLYVLFNLSLYMSVTCYVGTHLFPDNLIFCVHMAAINVKI